MLTKDALVIGLNQYDHLDPLKSPARDAEAIAQYLDQYCGFKVKRLPAFESSSGLKIARHEQGLFVNELKQAIIDLFNPESSQRADVALLYFSGHGVRDTLGPSDTYLATTECDPSKNVFGLHMDWLRRLLLCSPVPQQIVWLDCCYSGALLSEREEFAAQSETHSRCLVTASRDYEQTYESSDPQRHSTLTNAILKALKSNYTFEQRITNLSLTDHINDLASSSALAAERQMIANFGRKEIVVSGEIKPSTLPKFIGECPYKGLRYFEHGGRDPEFFFGRQEQADELLARVWENNFTALVGSSGSGKSSLLRAGLIYQMNKGQRHPGTEAWSVCLIQPGEDPLLNLEQELEKLFVDDNENTLNQADQRKKISRILNHGVDGLRQLAASVSDRLVVVIDQFEECFTICQDIRNRNRFLEVLMKAVEYKYTPQISLGSDAEKKFCVVLGMRADFLNKCLEQPYFGLAEYIKNNIVPMTPMDIEEIEEAICSPARLVNLALEDGLVRQMLIDVNPSAESLPLLQDTLTELWKTKENSSVLKLKNYKRLGGVNGTLRKRADDIYDGLSEDEQKIIEAIFLELIQIGNGSEVTRRRISKESLINLFEIGKAEKAESVLQNLILERLVVVTKELDSEIHVGRDKKRIFDSPDVIDIAHEALIKHWPKLRNWIDTSRTSIESKREIERLAKDWEAHKNSNDYLVRGNKLLEAEKLLGSGLQISEATKEFIDKSKKSRTRSRVISFGTPLFLLLAVAAGSLYLAYQQSRISKTIETVAINSSLSSSNLIKELPRFFESAQKRAEAGEVELAKAYYQKIITEVLKLKQQLESSSMNISPEDEQIADSLIEDSEDALARVVINEHLPALSSYLLNRRIGQLRPDTDLLDFEEQYTDGALQETYKALMRPTGVYADSNDDGEINSAAEARRLPCDLLEAIDKLWRELSVKDCGFYGDNSIYKDDQCSDLNGRTLSEVVFFGSFDSVEARLGECGLAPKQS